MKVNLKVGQRWMWKCMSNFICEIIDLDEVSICTKIVWGDGSWTIGKMEKFRRSEMETSPFWFYLKGQEKNESR